MFASVPIPASASRSDSAVRVVGPLRSSSLAISESARAWVFASIPKWARRRRLNAAMRGANRGRMIGRSSVAIRCTVFLIAHRRMMERSSVRASSTSAAVSVGWRARMPRRPAGGSWDWAPAIARRMSAGCRWERGR